MIILGIDYGKARTGIAVCDKAEMLAVPVCVITEYNFDRLLEKISQTAKERQAEMLVVGLPKNMDGSEGASAENARLLGEKLQEITGLEVQFSDERGTSIIAHNYLSETNVRGKKRKAAVDAVAATVILQNYLDFRKNTNSENIK